MRRSTLIGARLIEGPDREFAPLQDLTLIAIRLPDGTDTFLDSLDRCCSYDKSSSQ